MKKYLYLKLIAFVCILLFLTSCQFFPIEQLQPNISPSPLTPIVLPDPPAIQLFEIQPTEILVGESAILTWKVANASIIEISPGIGLVSPNSSVSVTPQERTTYQINARNADGSTNRNTVINVNRNSRAKPIALTIEEMEDLGFKFNTNSEPSQTGAASTYYVKFTVGLTGPTFIDNTVYIYRTTVESESVFAEEKNNNRMHITSYITIGTQGYYMIIQSAELPLSPTVSIRFQKNNVYVKMVSNLDFPEVEAFARLVEERIK